MTIQFVNPDGLLTPVGYHHVAVASPGTTVYVAGQVARDADGKPVGAGDLAAQSEQVYRNLVAALAGAGATFEHVVKLTAYVVDWQPEKLAELIGGAVRVAEELGIDIVRPITLVGVAALTEPDMLVEIEAVAVVPAA